MALTIKSHAGSNPLDDPRGLNVLGRKGGQIIAGGSDANDDLGLESTLHANKGLIRCLSELVFSRAPSGLSFRTAVAGARAGSAVLAAGSKVVATTAIGASSMVFVTSNFPGGTPGDVRVSARTAGSSFTITSSSGTDTSEVAWFIVNPF